MITLQVGRPERCWLASRHDLPWLIERALTAAARPSSALRRDEPPENPPPASVIMCLWRPLRRMP